MIILLVHHIIGIRPQLDHLLIRPRLLPGIKQIKASLPLRNIRLALEIESGSHQRSFRVRSNCQALRVSNKDAALAYPEKDIHVRISTA